MSKAFAIDFEWLERFTPDEAERFTFADIKITVGGVLITELALLRLVGDRLYSPDTDKFLPVTTVNTARQKFQRAFAQEFLCPSNALKDFIGEDFGEEKLDEAAHYFNVSTRVIETTLVNKGFIDRRSLFD
ncbi:MAG: hypothetical protein JZU65_09435 [Chlorobium sp.]|nr:hypothetical protein [Chlorobium sp.]